MLSYEVARAKIVEIVRARMGRLQTEELTFAGDASVALGRVLAENISADRNYPPFNRSTRDGFALRSADAVHPGAKLRLIGESRAGVAFDGVVATGTCVQIMTGAAVPRGADTIVMQEFTHMENDDHVAAAQCVRRQARILFWQEPRIARRRSRGRARGKVGYPELAMAAQVVGRGKLIVTRWPQGRGDSLNRRRIGSDRTGSRPFPDSQ